MIGPPQTTTSRPVRNGCRLFFALLALISLAPCRPARAQEPIPQTEQSDVAVLPPLTPHRVLVTDIAESHAKDGRIYVVDADAARMLGMMPAGYYANVVNDPANRNYYIAETYWSHGNRGARADLLSVYDAHTLALTREIALPGRALITTKKQDMDISADGRLVYVYNLTPSNSVIVVEPAKGAVRATVATSGCGLIFAWGNHGFSSICADGSLTHVDLARIAAPVITHTRPFFSADQDPVFEQSPSDRATGRTLFITYTGRVIPITLGPSAAPEPAWSIEQSAGQPAAPGADKPFVKAWRPGGWQIADLHRASHTLYVLMHEGTFWTHKQDGTEIWALDAASHRLLHRLKLPAPSNIVGVTQGADPMLLTASDAGGFYMLDPQTGAVRHHFDRLGDNLTFTTAPGE